MLGRRCVAAHITAESAAGYRGHSGASVCRCTGEAQSVYFIKTTEELQSADKQRCQLQLSFKHHSSSRIFISSHWPKYRS